MKVFCFAGRAKAGKIDPVLGGEAEVRQIIDILTRRRQRIEMADTCSTLRAWKHYTTR